MKNKLRKKVMGYLLLFILWVVIVAAMSLEMGVIMALVCWAVAGVFAGLLMLALKWIAGD